MSKIYTMHDDIKENYSIISYILSLYTFPTKVSDISGKPCKNHSVFNAC